LSEILTENLQEPSSNDPLVELKSGIYNLCINLLNNYVVYLGPEQSIITVCNFLDEISENFKNSIKDTEK